MYYSSYLIRKTQKLSRTVILLPIYSHCFKFDPFVLGSSTYECTPNGGVPVCATGKTVFCSQQVGTGSDWRYYGHCAFVRSAILVVPFHRHSSWPWSWYYILHQPGYISDWWSEHLSQFTSVESVEPTRNKTLSIPNFSYSSLPCDDFIVYN